MIYYSVSEDKWLKITCLLSEFIRLVERHLILYVQVKAIILWLANGLACCHRW